MRNSERIIASQEGRHEQRYSEKTRSLRRSAERIFKQEGRG